MTSRFKPITFIQYMDWLSNVYNNDKDKELIRWVNKWSANNKIDEETSVEKWRRENNDDTKSTPADIFNKSLNKMKDDVIKAQKYLEEVETMESEKNSKINDNDSVKATQQIEPTQSWRDKRDEVKRDKEEIERVRKLEEIRLRMRKTNIKWWKSCLTKEELMAVIAIRSFFKLQLTSMQDTIGEAMNNTGGEEAMKNGEGENVTSAKNDGSGYKRALDGPASGLISAVGAPYQQHADAVLGRRNCLEESLLFAAAGSPGYPASSALPTHLQCGGDTTGGNLLDEIRLHDAHSQVLMNEVATRALQEQVSAAQQQNNQQALQYHTWAQQQQQVTAQRLNLANSIKWIMAQQEVQVQEHRQQDVASVAWGGGTGGIGLGGINLLANQAAPLSGKRKNFTHNGITYNCTRYKNGEIPGNFTNYYSCTNVHHEEDNTWKKVRKTKDKVDDGKTKCEGSLIVYYTPSSGYIVKSNKKHKCNNE